MKTRKFMENIAMMVFVAILCLTCSIACTNKKDSTSEKKTNTQSQTTYTPAPASPTYTSVEYAIDNGLIHPGMTVGAVIKLLGEPRNRQKNRVCTCLYYGKYQLVFDSNGEYLHYNYN